MLKGLLGAFLRFYSPAVIRNISKLGSTLAWPWPIAVGENSTTILL